jgi:hypothetical protein
MNIGDLIIAGSIVLALIVAVAYGWKNRNVDE